MPRKNVRNKMSYSAILKQPLKLWVLFEIVAFIIGMLGYPGVPIQLFLGPASALLAVLFGAWAGARAIKVYENLWVSVISAFILSIITGFIGVLLIGILGFYSSGFYVYASTYAATANTPAAVASAALVFWVSSMFLAMAGSAFAYEVSARK